MVFIHENLSVVEWIAVVVAGLIAVAIVIAILTNLGGLVRYMRIKRM